MRPINPSIDPHLQSAYQHHQAGRLAEAEALYRQILRDNPRHADALHMLGVLAHQNQRHEEAVKLIRQAIALRPDFPEAYSNLGEALRSQGQFEAAITEGQQAIALNPKLAEAHYNLGNALRDQGRFEEAEEAFRQALKLKPYYPQAHNNLGNVLERRGLLEEAGAAYRQAVTLHPHYGRAYSNLGNVLRDQGQFAAALAAHRQAIALQPDAETYCNYGVTLADQGELEEAIGAYEQALALQADYPAAHNNLGNARKDQGELDAAGAAYRQAIALDPQYAQAHNNLGGVLKDRGRLDEAIAAYRKAIALRPDFAEAHSNLILALHYHPEQTRSSIAAELRCWNRQHAEPLKKYIPQHINGRDPERRLRIGYVSPDFREHVVGRYVLPLLANHDHGVVEVLAYAQVPREDALTARLRACTDGWRSIVGLSDAQAAELIHRDRIDILVDLAVHTAHNRLLVFARKPAPVQVSFAGYPGSTGLETIDYRLSDPYLDPPGAESVYSERVHRLPESFWCFAAQGDGGIPVSSLPARERGHVTFGCLNNLCKINAYTLALWALVLRQTPGAHLLLLAEAGTQRQWIIDRLVREGIEDKRVEFVVPRSREKYLEYYHRIDLGLDSFPYNGHTTSLDSLWMGVPVVTCVGPTAVARAGWSQLSNLGLPELAGQTPGEFVALAAGLAKDWPRLQQLRMTLRQRLEQSPLMAAPRYARNIEAAYRQMWRTWCESGDRG